MERYTVHHEYLMPYEHGNVVLYADAQATVEALQAQLPAEMQECTILFKECEKGHGRLTATNWIDHGCQTCEVEALQREVNTLNQLLRDKGLGQGEIDGMAAEHDELQTLRDERDRLREGVEG